MRITGETDRHQGTQAFGKNSAWVIELRRAAARHRESAERFYALSRTCWALADEVVFEEFGRREFEACARLERCANLHAGPESLDLPDGKGD